MREAALSPSPGPTDPGFNQWVQDSIQTLAHSSQIDDAPDQIVTALGPFVNANNLTVPLADSIPFYDVDAADSLGNAGSLQFATIGNSLLVTAGVLDLHFLGLQLLTAPVANSFPYYDEGGAAFEWATVASPLSLSGNSLSIATAGTDTLGAIEIAAVAEVYAAAAGALAITAALISSASATVALVDASTVSWDWTTGINFTLTMAASHKIGNPANGIPGTWRTILVQASSGTLTVTFDTEFLGDVPAISDLTSTKWYLLTIYCNTSTHFICSAKQAK